MQKIRLEQFSKNERDLISQYLKNWPEFQIPIEQLLEYSYKGFRKSVEGLILRPERKGYAYKTPASILASSLFFLSSELLQRAIAIRLLNNDVMQLVNTGMLCSRLSYLAMLAHDSDNSIPNIYSQDTEAFLLSLAFDDMETASAYVNRRHFPATRGHKFCMTLYNKLGFALNKSSESDKSQLLRYGKINLYDESTLNAVNSISCNNILTFDTSLNAMFKSYPRVTSDRGLLKYFACGVHGVFNLAFKQFEKTGQNIPSPSHLLWDDEFHNEVKNKKGIDLSVLSYFSNELLLLAKELPPSLAPESLNDL